MGEVIILFTLFVFFVPAVPDEPIKMSSKASILFICFFISSDNVSACSLPLVFSFALGFVLRLRIRRAPRLALSLYALLRLMWKVILSTRMETANNGFIAEMKDCAGHISPSHAGFISHIASRKS